MRDFFKPWRRKIGVVTLGLACAFMAGWVRSLSTRDLIVLPLYRQKVILAIFTRSGSFAICTESSSSSTVLSGYQWTSEPFFLPTIKLDWSYWEWLWRRTGWDRTDGKGFATWFVAPYGSIVLPLTLLSAYLLLSKPRPRKPANQSTIGT